MIVKKIYLIASLATTNVAFSQSLSGFIKDKKTGESISGVTIQNLSNQNISISNSYGYFSIYVDHFPVKLQATSISFKKTTVEISKNSTQQVLIEMESEENQLEELTVKSKKENQSLEKLPLGLINIPIQRLKAIPTLFGEADILKALTLTPGVSNANEGTTGILVRGGSPDQNLILIDETPVYNISHLFGLVSVFNPDAIKNVSLYKAAFPARYGGRLSSVIDISSKEGNTKKRNTEIGVGLINSRFLWEGPLNTKKPNSTTFFVAARASNLSFILLPTYLNYLSKNDGQYFNYNLFDINAKINKQFKNNSQLFLSTYIGNDIWHVKSKEGSDSHSNSNLKWGNITSSLRYITPINQKLFFKSTAAYTQYHYGIDIKTFISDKKTDYLDSKTIIQDALLKTSFEYFLNNNHEFIFGTDLIQHFYNPVKLSTTYGFANADNSKTIRATETGTYFESKNQLSPWFSVHSGLRFATFSVQDSTYISLEPRVAVNVKLPRQASFKIGYSSMKQYIHLLTNNSAGLPNDLWVPATKNVPPQFSQQLAASLSKNLTDGLSLSLEAYIKHYTNLIDYKNGKNYLTNSSESYENTIEKNGVGKTYGVEVFLDKNQGRFTGWLAYTLAWNYRKFENINDGKWFAANFDRRHNLALTGNYKISEKTDFSANWILQSGAPTNVPIAAFKSPLFNSDYPVFAYGDRNSYRMPAYHRLDFSFNFKAETYKGNQRVWTVGVYNAYNQKNPFYLDVRWGVQTNANKQVTGWNNNLVKRSVIPFLPFVNYTLKIK